MSYITHPDASPVVNRGTFIATAQEAVVASDFLCYDMGQTGDDRYRFVKLGDYDEIIAGTAIPAGVALAAAAANAPVEVCYWGICDAHLAGSATITIGDLLGVSATAGRVQSVTEAVYGLVTTDAEPTAAEVFSILKIPVVGIALETDATDDSTGLSAFIRCSRPI